MGCGSGRSRQVHVTPPSELQSCDNLRGFDVGTAAAGPEPDSSALHMSARCAGQSIQSVAATDCMRNDWQSCALATLTERHDHDHWLSSC